MRTLIVGMAPADSTAYLGRGPEFALTGRVGRRLASLCGCSYEEYVDRFQRINVIERPIHGEWPAVEASEVGARIKSQLFSRRVILLGRRVCDAVILKRLDFFSWTTIDGSEFACSPHPSGLSRWWNEPENVEIARRFWTAAFRGKDLPSRKT